MTACTIADSVGAKPEGTDHQHLNKAYAFLRRWRLAKTNFSNKVGLDAEERAREVIQGVVKMLDSRRGAMGRLLSGLLGGRQSDLELGFVLALARFLSVM